MLRVVAYLSRHTIATSLQETGVGPLVPTNLVCG